MSEDKKKENISKEQPVSSTTQAQSSTTQKSQIPQQPINNVQQQTQVSVCYSGFWVRGAAHIIDGIVIGIISMVIIFPLAFIIGFVSAMNDSVLVNIMTQGFIMIIAFAITWGYYIFMTHKFQATLGKMAVGAKVIDENGEKLSLGKITLRETIGKFISGALLGVGYLMIAFTSKKQGLHDMISNSVVVYKDAQKGANGVVVAIVYIIYGLLMTAVLAIFVFVVMIVGLTAFGGGNGDGSFNLNSFIENIDDGMTDDDYLNNDEYSDEIPFNIEGLEQLEDEVKDAI